MLIPYTGGPDLTPIIYLHRPIPFTELTALYSIADACLVASTRDGMNLVAFEYVACQEKGHGVLVISEFAGAAAFMGQSSITFHPANPQEIANAINRGLTIDGQERRANYEKLKQFVELNTRYVSYSSEAEGTFRNLD